MLIYDNSLFVNNCNQFMNNKNAKKLLQKTLITYETIYILPYFYYM